MTFRVLEISRFGLFYIKQSSACKSFWVITLDFTIPRHDGNENVKKNNRVVGNTTTLHVHHTFLYISLPFLHGYDVKLPNFTF